ncbi:MAG: SusC/RagA family TonB-linked outer membrane protein [Carboxylicivirga sp.]|nr:SusC/RagA family TonB-linked outer membrane protein [Carboxylicivirga sp.]
MFLLITSTVFASSFAQQKLSIKVNNATILDVLEKVEQQTELGFVFRKTEMDLNQRYTLDKSNVDVYDFLDELLGQQGFIYRIVGDNVVIKSKIQEGVSQAQSQEKFTITGIVIDINGEPIPGVNVFEKTNPQNGVITGIDGSYTIKVSSPDALLVYSFIGFEEQDVNVAGRNEVNITLIEEVTGLEEVVVVAYGKQKKAHLSAAVTQIKGDKLENRPLRTAADGLSGTVAGLNVRMPSGAPESTAKLNIRGFTGLGLNSKGQFEVKSAEPLVLINGVERSLADVNPNDIETISVLKDGASTAIYGSRAPYGAVIITTKSGKKNSSMKVSYSGNMNFSYTPNMPEQLKSYEWATYMNQAHYNRNGGGKGAFLNDLKMSRIKAWEAGDYDNEVFDGIDPIYVLNGVNKKNNKAWDVKYGGFGYTNYMEEVLKKIVPSQTHNLSVSGGGERATYYASIGYKQNNGIIKDVNDHLDRYNALISTKIDVTKWLDIELSADYVKTSEVGPSYRGGGRNYRQIWIDLACSWPIWVEKTPDGGIMDFSILPNLDGTGGFEHQDRNVMTMTGGAKIEPVKDWIIGGRYTYRHNNIHRKRTDLAYQQTLPDGTQKRHNRSINQSRMERMMQMADYYTYDINTSYTKDIGKHNFYVLAGFQQENQEMVKLTGKGNDFFSLTNQTLSGINGDEFAFDELQDYGTRGIYGRFSYNYASKYMLEVNVRHDATSRFLADSRWATFPSVSAAWNVGKENFWPLEDYISDFKLRGSWATSGDGNPDRLGNYPFYPSINTNSYIGKTGKTNFIYGGQLASYTTMPQLVSSDLTWSKPTSIGFAVDISALDNRLDMTYDWYQRTIHDQVGFPMVLPEVLGSPVPKSNNSTTETRGWGFSVNWRDTAFKLNGKDFRYNVGFLISDYVGYVVDFENSGTGERKNQWYAGQVFGQNYHYAFNELAQNTGDLYGNVPQGGGWYYPGDVMLQDLNGDGQVTTGDGETWYAQGDLIKNGFNYPRKTYSINLGADWNNISLSVMLDGVGQWNKYVNNQNVFGTNGNKFASPFYRKHVDLGYYTTKNTDAFYPRIDASNKNLWRANDYYDLDLAHLRIRNITLGYTLPEIKGLRRAYVYVSGENLGFIYNKSFIKYDPELLAASNGEGYPPQRVISLGLNVEF